VLGSALVTDLPIAIKVPTVILAVFAVAWFAEAPYQRFVLRLRTGWRARRVTANLN
jgi:hypothetical protein